MLTDSAEKQLDILKNKLTARLQSAGSIDTGVCGVTLFREEEADKIIKCFHAPFIIFIISGEKHSVFGKDEFIYGPGSLLVTCVDYPVSSYISGISKDNPYLSILIPVDKNVVAELLRDMDNIPNESLKGISITQADSDMTEIFIRLINGLDSGKNAGAIIPIIVREIHYRILTSSIGGALKAVYTHGSKSNKILQAVSYLKNNFKEYIKMDVLAEMVNMAPSTFNRHFKIITTLSPLQYQKRLRLYEAQRLMLTEDITAYDAGYAVGYESVNQFTREYKDMFGEPPRSNVKKILSDYQNREIGY